MSRTTSESDFRQILESPNYERLRARLIRVFAQRGHAEPEELADETVARVTAKLDEIAPIYDGDPSAYFLAVARNVHLEQMRKPSMVELSERDLPAARTDPDDDDDASECLEDCLTRLDREDRFLIVEYYRYEKGATIDHRQLLSEAFDLGANALRIRAHRIRARLGRCVTKCVKSSRK